MSFSFDASEGHRYSLDGVPVLSVTQLLTLGGLVDTTWFSEKTAARGTEIHRICADYDLGALTLEEYDGLYRGYLEAHIRAMKILNPVWEHVETAFVHPRYRFAGRPDRIGRVYGAVSVVDTKSGGPADWHGVQLALQGILVSPEVLLAPDAIHRYAIYLNRSGKYQIRRYEDRRDFDVAYSLLTRFAHGADVVRVDAQAGTQ